jgi:phenylpyruvate tautomerase PptA (4-oxalocrotonate tautomerase family)
MPYLRITCPELPASKRREIAARLTNEIVSLFFNPRANQTEAEVRSHTSIHFLPYRDDELFIGGQTPSERGLPDLTVELSDWSMSVKKQRRVAKALTPVLAEVFGVRDLNEVNIRFHSYSPTDFSVGGTLLADRIPAIGRVMKKLMDQ